MEPHAPLLSQNPDRAREAQETRQLKEQAYQLKNEWVGNSAVLSRTSHGGTEKTLLQKILAALMSQKRQRATGGAPASSAKGPQATNSGSPKTSMIDQMQGKSKPGSSNAPAAHELPIGE